MAASLFERLKVETNASHADVERRIDELHREWTPSSYRTLLERLYGLYCPLEAELARSISEIAPWLPDIEERMRTESLCLDLRSLGNRCPESLPMAVVPLFGSVAHQFGCLYVLEGSKLGGQLIAGEVKSHLRMDLETGCSFFAGHGVNTVGCGGAFVRPSNRTRRSTAKTRTEFFNLPQRRFACLATGSKPQDEHRGNDRYVHSGG